jgi:hypothetical protein
MAEGIVFFIGFTGRALHSGGVHRIGVRNPCHRKQHAIPNPLIMKSFLVARPMTAVRFLDAAVRKPDSSVELRLNASCWL